jgi:hypothetical protein
MVRIMLAATVAAALWATSAQADLSYDPNSGSWTDTATGRQITPPISGVSEKNPLYPGSCEAKALARGMSFPAARRVCSGKRGSR